MTYYSAWNLTISDWNLTISAWNLTITARNLTIFTWNITYFAWKLTLTWQFMSFFQDFDLTGLSSEENSEEIAEVQGLILRLIQMPNVSIDLALLCGNFYVKLMLVVQTRVPSSSFTKLILDQIQSLEFSDFSVLCILTGCLNHGPVDDPALLAPILSKVLKLCSRHSTNHSYQCFQALKLWSVKSKQCSIKTCINEGKY